MFYNNTAKLLYFVFGICMDSMKAKMVGKTAGGLA